MAVPKSDTRREEIIQAAAGLFEMKGYHHTSMDDIANAIGIRKPSLYHYVEGKGQIVAWIHDRQCDSFNDRLAQRIDADLTPSECLHGFVRDVFEALDTEPGHLRVYFEHHREIPAQYQASSRAKRDQYFAGLKQLIIAGEAAHEFTVEDPEMASFALVGMCNWGYQWYRAGGRLGPAEIAEMFWRIFSRGISSVDIPP